MYAILDIDNFSVTVIIQIREEFQVITKCTTRLHSVWQKYKPLELAASTPNLNQLIAAVNEDMDEGKCCLEYSSGNRMHMIELIICSICYSRAD